MFVWGKFLIIDQRLADLFDEEPWLTAVFYYGDLGLLSKDLKIALHARIGENILKNTLENPADFLTEALLGFVLSFIVLVIASFQKERVGRGLIPRRNMSILFGNDDIGLSIHREHLLFFD